MEAGLIDTSKASWQGEFVVNYQLADISLWGVPGQIDRKAKLLMTLRDLDSNPVKSCFFSWKKIIVMVSWGIQILEVKSK